MSEQLYKKVQQGDRVRYLPYIGPVVDSKDYQLTNEQAVSIAGALGVTLLCIFERLLPPHKIVARKIKAVENAILDLFHGTGHAVDPAVTDWVLECWDKTVLMAAEIPGKVDG